MLQQALTGAWQFRQVGSDEWSPAQVPGSVQLDLLHLGRIPDPFEADNEKRVKWVAEADWEYRSTFSVSPELLAQQHVFLVCDGLDTLAEVRLNGQLVDRTDNMFRPYRWQVKALLGEGENELRIIFRSPVQYISAKMAERPLPSVPHPLPGAAHLRKAPCQFGWDWGPRLPPLGVWRDIRLEGYSLARFSDVHLRQHHQAGQVRVRAALRLERWSSEAGALVAELRVAGPDGVELSTASSIAADDHQLEVIIERSQLWWPNGYGEQPLYQVEISLTAGDQLCDRRHYQLGLRTLELRQEDDEWGQSFTFVVNGLPIFAKGSNWIPADSFPTRLTAEHLERLIRAAAATHQNMLRVWGGGFYEDERFYDLCDQYGLLVWQDFIFSCSVYPLDEAGFVEKLAPEVLENIRRLRHRACLALWCGNNEMDWAWESWGWAGLECEAEVAALAEKVPALRHAFSPIMSQTPVEGWRELREGYRQFFYTTLPQWVAQADPDRAYWPSSPSSNTPFNNANGQHQGDAHYWEVWHGRQPFTAYRQQYPRFMSEFGFQSLPPLETIRTYAPEVDWNLTSYLMEHHQKNDSGNGLIIGQMADNFRMPKDFLALVYLSMVLQAEGIRSGVEHWRRNKHRVSGTLYWQLNDCWPVASWSSLDYFGRWKALHYAARRFYAPVLLSIEDAPPRMSLHLTSDLAAPWAGSVRWSLETLEGLVLESGEERVLAQPLASTLIRAFDFAGQISEDNCRQLVFVAELWHEAKRVAWQVAPFGPTKHLALTEPDLVIDLRRQDQHLILDLTARSMARYVELSLEGVDVVFSDNYFDLPAGRTVSLSGELPPGWSLDQAKAALSVRSLYNSFA